MTSSKINVSLNREKLKIVLCKFSLQNLEINLQLLHNQSYQKINFEIRVMSYLLAKTIK